MNYRLDGPVLAGIIPEYLDPLSEASTAALVGVGANAASTRNQFLSADLWQDTLHLGLFGVSFLLIVVSHMPHGAAQGGPADNIHSGAPTEPEAADVHHCDSARRESSDISSSPLGRGNNVQDQVVGPSVDNASSFRDDVETKEDDRDGAATGSASGFLPQLVPSSPDAKTSTAQKRIPAHLSPQHCNAKRSRASLDIDTELARDFGKKIDLRTSVDLDLFVNGTRGLRNLGNTCYMNACLQCLAQCGTFAEYFIRMRHEAELNRENISAKGAMAEAYGKLINAMWAKSDPQKSAIRPSKVKAVIGEVASYFSGYEQHDAQELLRCLLDAIHEDVNRVREKVPYEEIQDVDNETVEATAQRWWAHYEKRNDSHVKDVFGGQLYSLVTCKTCGNQSKAFDPVLDLSVPIASPDAARVSLEDCLSAMVEEETLDGDNACYCRKCKSHQPSTRALQIFRAPQTLVVHLKRFAQKTPFQRTKLQTRVSLPLEGTLDLSPFCHKLAARDRPMYRLVAMVNHMGTLSGGHYTANARHVRTSVWHNYNDDRVTEIDPGNIDTSSAYLLFLERVHPVSADVVPRTPVSAQSHL
ncbi:Ubiquitin carboxyl-terminal hydrolase 2 [Hondaea fermentalgiana]|uniref:Ubiquitin carboxyl-terminal hydrolase n=1 Tax=Hondaea fermentalgiana TaxID=2315210 RepID=A0A2R5GSD2_9STRA|nr:Ubiquitin carboxyl-terminal hydrolase 2 [Hondaea fermentalgiana]|eukprot:GBG31553.1 Ubiquitin carboxyl-terminal hydrolase 2 [Hondaea fermentalgiana]